MSGIKIIGRGKYLPKQEVTSADLSKKFNVTEEYICKVCGIKSRWYGNAEDTLEKMAYKASLDAIKNGNINCNDIDLIIVATTSSNKMMPGISYLVQSLLNIKDCMCLDILAGCNGFVNAFDIAQNYIEIGKINTALVIGVEKLSSVVNADDMSTAILFGDGAGATIITKSENNKKYYSKFKSQGQNAECLTYEIGKKLAMDGTKIYKYAVAEVPRLVNETLNEANLDIEKIDHIVLHQSNTRIMSSIAKKLKIRDNRLFSDIENVGNTFCASIPIALTEIDLQEEQYLLMCGYGGGLNTGCILLEL